MTSRSKLLTLGQAEPRIYEKKEIVSGPPDVSMLYPDQLTVFNGLVNFLERKSGGIAVLKGYAGTGKTTVISKVVQDALNTYTGELICVTAPTNKAVKVLMGKADYRHSNLEYSTLHRLLGLKEVIEDGVQKFLKDWDAEASIEECGILIVDEASMISDEIFGMVLAYVPKGLRLIFVGDPAQIPPINEVDCIPFQEEEQERLEMKIFELTEIVRQAKGNPILIHATDVRSNLHRDYSGVERETQLLEDGSGVCFLNRADMDHGELLEDILYAYFNSENFKVDADFAKVIAWRNKVVNFMNYKIRRMIYGDHIGKLEIGEKMIANKPIVDGEIIIMTTNDEFEIIGLEEGVEKINGGAFEIPYYKAKCLYVDPFGNEREKHIRVVHEDGEATYNEVLSMLNEIAKSKDKGTTAAKMAWADFWNFKKYFADVKYNYAITAHKAQGSTYVNTIVIEGDLNLNRKLYERNRIKYTAFTRSSKRLIVVD